MAQDPTKDGRCCVSHCRGDIDSGLTIMGLDFCHKHTDAFFDLIDWRSVKPWKLKPGWIWPSEVMDVDPNDSSKKIPRYRPTVDPDVKRGFTVAPKDKATAA